MKVWQRVALSDQVLFVVLNIDMCARGHPGIFGAALLPTSLAKGHLDLIREWACLFVFGSNSVVSMIGGACSVVVVIDHFDSASAGTPRTCWGRYSSVW